VTPLELVLSKLTGVSADGRSALCPAHDDRRRSLSIGTGKDGRVLIKCHAGCALGDILRALNLAFRDLFPTNGQAGAHDTSKSRVDCRYDYRDEKGEILFQVERFEPKDFRQRRPDGKGGWISNLDGVRRVPYRLPELIAAPKDKWVFIVEGEKDADALARLGLVATTNPGGAEKWRPEFNLHFKRRRVAIVPDNDEAGQKHSRQVARNLLGVAFCMTLIELPCLQEKGDVSDWLAAGGTRENLLALVESTAAMIREDLEESDASSRREVSNSPWDRAVTAAEFLAAEAQEAQWLAESLAAPGSITVIASPRGLGKTHALHALAIAVATGGVFRGQTVRQGRVLLIDRDNSRREIHRRLVAWGAAGLSTLRIVTRDDAPPLDDAKAWAAFPFADYDLVLLDSLSAAAERAKSGDAGEWGAALAPLLDLARRGPAVVLLANTRKDGGVIRDSGVIGDRADIVYEVRDATDLVPDPKMDTWWDSLPEAGEAAWSSRSKRRRVATTIGSRSYRRSSESARNLTPSRSRSASRRGRGASPT
jgi:hypothetical protein